MISLNKILDEVKPIRKNTKNEIQQNYIGLINAIDFFDLDDSLGEEMSNWDYSSDEEGLYDGFSLMKLIHNNAGFGFLEKHPISDKMLMVVARKYHDANENDELDSVDQENVNETYDELLRSAQKLGIL